MYEAHFGLSEAPFSLTPDTDFFFPSRHHQEALNVLLLAVEQGEGFIKLTGEVGTGKTLLCRKLLRDDSPDRVSAWIPNAMLDADALRAALAAELDIAWPAGLPQHEQLERLNQRLLELAGDHVQVLVCIDEAQTMPDESLEALRLLSNLETEKRKLMSIVLFGQPELDERLARPEWRQLRSRISFSHRLGPLDVQDVRDYLDHRIRRAGCARGQTLFTPSAIRALAWGSRGIPRLLNQLAHKSLLACFGEGRGDVDRRHVRRACQDTVDARRPGLLHALSLMGGWSRP